MRLICGECREHFPADREEMAIKMHFLIQFGRNYAAARTKDACNFRIATVAMLLRGNVLASQ